MEYLWMIILVIIILLGDLSIWRSWVRISLTWFVFSTNLCINPFDHIFLPLSDSFDISKVLQVKVFFYLPLVPFISLVIMIFIGPIARWRAVLLAGIVSCLGPPHLLENKETRNCRSIFFWSWVSLHHVPMSWICLAKITYKWSSYFSSYTHHYPLWQ